MLQEYVGGRIYDMITNEPAAKGDMILDTEIKSGAYRPIKNNRTMFIKESTIVWLAEKAGYTLVKRDAGDSGDAASVDTTNAGVGDGEVEVGEVEVGGGTKPARRSSRTTKSK